jgi:hypothetical protein
MLGSDGWGGCNAVVAWTAGEAVVQTGGVEIEITGDAIRLGQLLTFANLVSDGGEAKALIVSGRVRVDGRLEIAADEILLHAVTTGGLEEVS